MTIGPAVLIRAPVMLDRMNDPLIDAHCNRLALAGYRPRSIEARRICLSAFADHAAPTRLVDATRYDLEGFLGRPQLSAQSRRTYRSHLRSFYAWCVEDGVLDSSPAERLPAVRVPRYLPRPVTEADLVVALQHADARMRAWLLLMSLGGLRCVEVAALRPDDLRAGGAAPMLFLRECKGGGTASIPAHPAIVDALTVLPVRDGLWWDVTPRHVSMTVSAYLRSVGVNATAHRLRHFAGTAWFRASGHDLLTTATLMRHANVQTTTVYAQLDPTRPAEVVRAVLPALSEDRP